MVLPTERALTGELVERMRSVWLALAALAGCGGHGVDLEVHTTNSAAASVELFVAPNACLDSIEQPCAQAASDRDHALCSVSYAWNSIEKVAPPLVALRRLVE